MISIDLGGGGIYQRCHHTGQELRVYLLLKRVFEPKDLELNIMHKCKFKLCSTSFSQQKRFS